MEPPTWAWWRTKPRRAEGLVLNEDLILEIVRPGTGDPVPDGEVGEVVVTTFNPDYPLVRFATGDLSAVLAGASPCGRTNVRIKGWMGRADQATKVRGMFVHPHQVAEVCAATGLRAGAWWWQRGGRGPHDAARRADGADAGLASAASSRGPCGPRQGARRGALCTAGEPAQRRKGDRRFRGLQLEYRLFPPF